MENVVNVQIKQYNDPHFDGNFFSTKHQSEIKPTQLKLIKYPIP